MRQWVLIPHFYQPPTQSTTLTELILRSCYLPLLDLLLGNPHVEMTFNLSASLVLQLETIPNHNFFSKVHELVERNQIEFLNSAIFHPILPLTPLPVIDRQTKENAEIIERFCGCKPVSGFFPPELAVDQKILEHLNKKFDFVVVDESSVNPEFDLNAIPSLPVYQFTSLPINLFASSRSLSEIIRSYPTELKADNLIHFVEDRTAQNQIIVNASDAEVFGHHYSERINLLKDLFAAVNHFKFIKATTALSLDPRPQTPDIAIVPSSWQTTKADLQKGTPFALWNSPNNLLQKKYQHLAKLAYEALEKSEKEDSNSHFIHSSQHHFDQGISSCHSYWLSNSPWWHPDLAEQGARNLVKSIRTLPVSPEEKRQAEQFYHAFMLEVWDYHWSGKVEENYLSFDQNRGQNINTLPEL